MSWSGSFSYSWNPPRPARRVTTSPTELLHLGVAYAVLTVDILLIFAGLAGLSANVGGGHFSRLFFLTVGVAAGAALTGFVAHEMAHKIVAQRRGYWAEFRVFPMGLLVSLLTASFGFLFAAPGATMVGGMSELDRESWGWTSIAGPLTNAAFAAVFYAGAVGAYLAGSFLVDGLLLLAFINAWFGTFNLIPFGPLDGRKVYRWNRAIWTATIVGTGAASALMYFAQSAGSPFLGL